MTAAAVIGLSGSPWKRLVARLRDEHGIGLVELLIALLVLNVGIFATLAAFTSGALAIRRASRISTASAVADKYMECFRNSSYDNIKWPMTSGNCTATSVIGANGQTFNVSATVVQASQQTAGSGKVKKVTLTVTDANDANIHVTNASTFSLCTQAVLSSNSNPCQS